MSKSKIIVLDDDPTGSQTVHSCLLLMVWDVETLKSALKDESPIFFVLTNTRSLTPERAASVTKEVCHNLKTAIAAVGIEKFSIVSRSDSTLRGHYPIETDIIAEELGGFDAHFLVPAFFEGGRVTKDSIHYLLIDGQLTPVHQTEFARDSVFGYKYSYLPDYVAEKTAGRIEASAVERFLLADIRAGIGDRLMKLKDNQCAVVDAESQNDLDRFAEDILTAADAGKRFLFRSAASLLTSLAKLGNQPLAPEEMSQKKPTQNPGAVIVGSHVTKTTQQLKKLLQEDNAIGIEVDVKRLRDSPAQRQNMLEEILGGVDRVYQQKQTPVVYTSRDELVFATVEERLQFGIEVSSLLMDIVKGLPKDIGFLISKGGITSNDVLSKGLALKKARLLGQILPGCSVVITPEDLARFPNLPVVLFPGNVGDELGLVTAYTRLSS